MSAPTRRAVLGGASLALVAAGAALVPAAAGAIAALADHADAELIWVCAQHAINMDTYNAGDDDDPLDENTPGPLWAA